MQSNAVIVIAGVLLALLVRPKLVGFGIPV